MKSETDPITEDEWLLRRVHSDRFKSNRVPTISPSAFEPRIKGHDPDVDGISLYREACLGSANELLASMNEDKRREQAVVRIGVRFLHQLGLTVTIKPDLHVKGHVVIPELNSVEYAASKSRFTAIFHGLAVEASRDENIAIQPSA